MLSRMLRRLAVALLLGSLLVGVAASGSWASTGEDEQGAVGLFVQPARDRQMGLAAPAISFIESPTATCHRPDLETDVCYVNWGGLSVSTVNPSYVISMTVTIDGRVAAVHQGFFQSAMYVPSTLYDQGFRVACGMADPTRTEGLGGTHSYVVRARDSSGLQSANYGIVVCPVGTLRIYIPVVLRATL